MNTELELLHSVLDPDSRYPWNPLDPESQVLLADGEAEWDEDHTADAIATGWQTLATQLDTFWATQDSGALSSLLAALEQRFSPRMPRTLLQDLAQQALAVADASRPLIDQLLACTRSVLADWNPEDLTVLARPLAYSLRDGRGEILDLHLRSIRQTEWSQLSQVEQARLSLAVASFALQQAHQDQG